MFYTVYARNICGKKCENMHRYEKHQIHDCGYFREREAREMNGGRKL